MKLNIKVKHLVYAAAIVIMIPLLFQYVVPQARALLDREQEKSSGVLSEKEANRILAELERLPDSSKRKWTLIADHFISTSADSIIGDADIIIGAGTVMEKGPDLGRSFLWQEKAPYLEQYVTSGPANGYLVRAAKQLAYYYDKTGEQSKAIACLQTAEDRMHNEENYVNSWQELALARAKLLSANGDIADSNQVLEKLSEQSDSNWLNQDMTVLKVQNLIRQGKLKEALALTGDHISEARKSEQGWRNALVPSPTTLGGQIKKALQQGTGPVEVGGTLKRSDGSPIAGAGVFLRYDHDLNHSVMEQELHQTMTAADGSFVFRGVLTGQYKIYLGLSYDQLDGYSWSKGNDDWIEVQTGGQTTSGNAAHNDEHMIEHNIVLTPLIELVEPVNQMVITEPEVTFRWEPVEGAAYYNLLGRIQVKNGSIGSVMKSYIKGHELRLTTDELYRVRIGLSFGESGDWNSISPESLLGFANTDNRFAWEIQAYDHEGRQLSSSGGYRLREETMGNLPFFYLKARTMTAADHLVLAGKMDEALAAYRAAYEEDEKDIYSLNMLIRMLSAKDSVVGDAAAKAEAFHYLKRLRELTAAPDILNELLMFYYEQRNWSAYHAELNEYLRISGQPLNDYEQSIYATALMMQEKLEDAAKAFQVAMEIDNSHRFVGNYLAVLLSSRDTMEPALRVAKKYPERMLNTNERYWELLVEQLQQEASLHSAETGDNQSTAAYKAEMKRVLAMHYRGEDVKLQAWLTQAKNRPALRAFVQALQGVS